MSTQGDNGKRARAYPTIEGRCGECGRWFALRNHNMPRHNRDYAKGSPRCKGLIAVEIHPPIESRHKPEGGT